MVVPTTIGVALVGYDLRTDAVDVPEGGTTVRLSFPDVADATEIDTGAVSGR